MIVIPPWQEMINPMTMNTKKSPDVGGKSTGRRTTVSDLVQKGSRAAKLRPDAGSVRSVDRGSNGRDDRTRPVRTWLASGQ